MRILCLESRTRIVERKDVQKLSLGYCGKCELIE